MRKLSFAQCRKELGRSSFHSRVAWSRTSCSIWADLKRAMDEAQRAKAAFEPGWGQAYRGVTPHDFANAVDYLLANLAWIMGDAHRALACARETRRRAEEMGEPFTLSIVLSFLATLYYLADRVPEAREVSEALFEVTSAHGISFYARLGAVTRAWAREGSTTPTKVRERLGRRST